MPRTQVEQLTRLFEMVRYGAHAANKREEQAAVACLDAIANMGSRDSLGVERRP